MARGNSIRHFFRWNRGRSWLGLAVSVVLVVAVVAGIRFSSEPESASAKAPRLPFRKRQDTDRSNSPQSAGPQDAPPIQSDYVATVNHEEISRDDLARQCLWHYGEEVLESLVNVKLISQECQRRNIAISREEVDAEVARMASRFGIPQDQWLQMLERERNITPKQYMQDIVWPMLALKKLGAASVEVTQTELHEAYENQFGPAVQTRLIACDSRSKAEQALAEAHQNPDDFGNVAKKYSDDVNSASVNGLIPPIRKHFGEPQIEQAAFALKPGEISPILQVGGQFVILKCEKHFEARQASFETAEPTLRENLRDQKIQTVAHDVMQQLQKNARIENVFNDEAKSRQMPGVAAVVNGQKIMVRTLADACIERHGLDVVDGMVSRKILEQECRRVGVNPSDADINAELDRAAMSMGKVDAQGRPDRDAWISFVTEEQGIPMELYIHDTVWPTVALKLLVGGHVAVTEEDLRKGFEANYGPRVRCRAILMDNQRRAVEVWQMARDNPTAEYFGTLAEQYSSDASSRSLRGEIPPIQKFGGEPKLEEEAFSLKPGDVSAVIQVGDRYVILFCEGYTEPKVVDFNAVRDLLAEDIREKKLRVAMAERFDAMKESARVHNRLAADRLVGHAAPASGQRPAGPRPAGPPTAAQAAPIRR